MSDPARERVQQAYRLVKAGRRTEALHLLQQVILVDDQNVNAWWLMAYMVESPADKRAALEHVLRLRPNHSKARRVLARLLERHPELAEERAPPEPAPARRRAKRPPPQRPKTRSRRWLAGKSAWLIAALGLAVIALFVVLLVVVLLAGGG